MLQLDLPTSVVGVGHLSPSSVDSKDLIFAAGNTGLASLPSDSVHTQRSGVHTSSAHMLYSDLHYMLVEGMDSVHSFPVGLDVDFVSSYLAAVSAAQVKVREEEVWGKVREEEVWGKVRERGVHGTYGETFPLVLSICICLLC